MLASGGMRMAKQPSIKIQEQWLLVVGIVFIASTLRAPLTAVGPVIHQIKIDLHINDMVAGLITTIPLVIFGVISIWVTRFITRYNMSMILFIAVMATIAGMVIRTVGGMVPFFVGTTVLGVAIAFCNVTLPAFAKNHFPLQIGLITGIYSATMNLTAGLGGGFSFPLSTVSTLDYRLSLSFWILFGVIAILCWLPQLKSQTEPKTRPQQTSPVYNIVKSRLAWAVAILMAFQSMTFYCIVAWYPSILISKGIAPDIAGYMLMLNQFAQLPMTFTFPIIAAKMRNQRRLIHIITALFGLGFTLLWSHQFWIILLAMIFSGMAVGACFSLCMTLFSIRAKTTTGSMQLSGFGQTVGYLIAAIGPFLMGAIHEWTNAWSIAISMFIGMTMLIFIAGHYATTTAVIEDELIKK